MTANWGKLYVQDRCYGIGVPWSEGQAIALYKLGIPAQYIRRGCLTLEDYELMQKEDIAYEKKTGEKPLEVLSRDELLIKVGEKGVEVTPQAPHNVLVELLRLKKKLKVKTKEVEKPKAEKITKTKDK